MKKLILLLAIIPFMCFSQDNEKLSNYDKLMSLTGRSLKMIEYDMESPANYSTATIRKIISEDEPKYYLYMTSYSSLSKITKRGSFSYGEILSILTKLVEFQKEILTDRFEIENVSYIENKYITEDNYKVGYYISSPTKEKWFIDVAPYSSAGTITFKDAQSLIDVFFKAKLKIEHLKSISEN